MSVEDPLSWMSYADEDLQAARVLQESVEKSRRLLTRSRFTLTSRRRNTSRNRWLCTKGKSHNLRLLLTRVGEYAPELNIPGLEDAANALDQFYIPSRQEAAEALAWAEEIAVAVRPRLWS